MPGRMPRKCLKLQQLQKLGRGRGPVCSGKGGGAGRGFRGKCNGTERPSDHLNFNLTRNDADLGARAVRSPRVASAPFFSTMVKPLQVLMRRLLRMTAGPPISASFVYRGKTRGCSSGVWLDAPAPWLFSKPALGRDAGFIVSSQAPPILPVHPRSEDRDATLWRADAGSVETRRRDDVRAFSWQSTHCRSRHCIIHPHLAEHHSAAQNSTRWQHLQPPAMPSTKVNGKIHRWDAVDALDGWQSHLNRTDHQQSRLYTPCRHTLRYGGGRRSEKNRASPFYPSERAEPSLSSPSV
ncbi:hypothetical protein B0T11DRAFT_74501 [Plectosphaerella cucumerina]|uniref:Uncharacterized protein n=1 Tax=Plectosphaerella cucumerina TaxID=40658 RepID=A0A8K0X298_9PEZI|nr:hypothetical protein B0T11DRAFT_74501 [Plectosphaerella cucumerina]